MHLEALTFTNFRCFGAEPVRVEFVAGTTTFIGVNGTGKTAAMEGLLRVFGISQHWRRIRLQDFHVPADEDPDHRPTERTLSIEAVFAFPELEGAEREEERTDAVPAFFAHMGASREGVLKCRIRLEAIWQDDGTTEGDIDSDLWVITSLEDDYDEEDRHRLSPSDRSRIQVLYVPAVREGAEALTRFLRHRVWRAARWSDQFQAQVKTTTEELNERFSAESAVSVARSKLSTRWAELHTGGTNTDPSFRPVSPEFSDLVDRAELVFEPTETGPPRNARELSDGQQSLLQIALTATALDLEAAIASGLHNEAFDEDKFLPPALTILALEEPENSLAPFFLSRIIGQLQDLGKQERAQVIVSSHAPSVLSRIRPDSIRYFRLDTRLGPASITPLTLPEESDSQAKYVREAVQAFPELYFARFVVLGEGASEQIVLPLLAAAADLLLDPSFVAVVPLGGRHVNHFWRLLDDLEIPYATLLDLDQGRHQGGLDRIRQIRDELQQVDTEIQAPSGADGELDYEGDDLDDEELRELLETLEQSGVYFCEPLDLDWNLLQNFPEAYRSLPDGATGPGDSDAAPAVLGEGGDSRLYEDYADDLRWYRYLFLGRSKPVTHLRVLSGIDDGALRTRTPEVLTRLIDQIRAAVNR